jgi:hypothetical protein
MPKRRKDETLLDDSVSGPRVTRKKLHIITVSSPTSRASRLEQLPVVVFAKVVDYLIFAPYGTCRKLGDYRIRLDLTNHYPTTVSKRWRLMLKVSPIRLQLNWIMIRQRPNMVVNVIPSFGWNVGCLLMETVEQSLLIPIISAFPTITELRFDSEHVPTMSTNGYIQTILKLVPHIRHLTLKFVYKNNDKDGIDLLSKVCEMITSRSGSRLMTFNDRQIMQCQGNNCTRTVAIKKCEIFVGNECKVFKAGLCRKCRENQRHRGHEIDNDSRVWKTTKSSIPSKRKCACWKSLHVECGIYYTVCKEPLNTIRLCGHPKCGECPIHVDRLSIKPPQKRKLDIEIGKCIGCQDYPVLYTR